MNAARQPGWYRFVCQCGSVYESPYAGPALGACRRRDCDGRPVRQ